MGSFVGCYPLHSLSSSKCLQQHAEGGILPIAVPAPSGSLKQKHRRPVLASRSDGEMASLGNMKKMENSCMNRRAILALIALSASPVFTPRSFADEDPVADRKDERLLGASRSQKPEIVAASPASQEQNVTTEFAGEGKSPVSTLFGFLNELGIVGSGVLGALFALERKERAAKESTVEAVVAELKERKVAMASLRESLEGKMLEEKNKYLKEARKAQEEQAILSKELASANLASKQFQDTANSPPDVSLQIESMQAELNQIQKKLGDADRSQLESEVATNSLHDAVTGEQVAEESFGSSCLNT